MKAKRGIWVLAAAIIAGMATTLGVPAEEHEAVEREWDFEEVAVGALPEGWKSTNSYSFPMGLY